MKKLRAAGADEDADVSNKEELPVGTTSSLGTQVQLWLQEMPPDAPATQVLATDPLSRFAAREGERTAAALSSVRNELESIAQTLRGDTKQTNETRILMKELSKGIILTCNRNNSLSAGLIPMSWRSLVTRDYTTVTALMTDLAARVKQNASLTQLSTDPASVSIKLGQLFQPDAFITATRQYTSQQKGWSLEELHLTLEPEELVEGDFVLEGGLLLGRPVRCLG